MIKIFLCVLIATLGVSISSCKKKNIDGNSITDESSLTRALQEIYTSSDISGYTVGIIINNEIKYQKSFGKQNIANNIPYTNKTTQPIASVSKTFVAAAIVKAIEQGHFNLETDINEILPFEIKNPKVPDGIIRVKHLVTHTSGFTDDNVDIYANFLKSYYILLGEDMNTEGSRFLKEVYGSKQRTGISLEHLMKEYYLKDGSRFSYNNFNETLSGKEYSYSNIATSLAAYLIEIKTGKSFKDYVKDNILIPLDMTQTAYSIENLNPNHVAMLYLSGYPLPVYGSDSYPSGSINISNEDMSKYLLDMMKGFRGQSSILFSKESYALLFEPIELNTNSIFPQHSVFWFVEDNIISHDGGDPGVSTRLLFDKIKNTGYFFHINYEFYNDYDDRVLNKLRKHIDNTIQDYVNSN